MSDVQQEGGCTSRARVRAATDEVLLQWMQAGSRDAFAELYRRHHADAVRYAARLSRQHVGVDLGEDIAAEAVRKVYSAVQRGGGPVIGFRQYLFTAVRSVTYRRRRTEMHDRRVATAPEADLPAVDEQIEGLVAMTAFRSLPERWQNVLWATKVLELTPTEVAEHLGVRPNSIAALAMRAREALRVAYVRAHLPPTQDEACAAVLDAVARRAVARLGETQRLLIAAHLPACDDCRRAADALAAELDGRSRSVARSEGGRTIAAVTAAARPIDGPRQRTREGARRECGHLTTST